MWGNAIYLRTSKRRPVRRGPYRQGEDLQGSLPYAWCVGCGKEVYGRFSKRCAECGRCKKSEKDT